MPPRKSKPRQSQTPPQTTFIEPVPQVKNSDILDIDEAVILSNVAQKAGLSHKKTGLDQGIGHFIARYLGN